MAPTTSFPSIEWHLDIFNKLNIHVGLNVPTDTIMIIIIIIILPLLNINDEYDIEFALSRWGI